MKELGIKATHADCIRAINSLVSNAELTEKRLVNLEVMLNDLNNTVIEILAMAGFDQAKVELDS